MPGSSIPSINNDEVENLRRTDFLVLAIIRVGQYCLDNIFYPAATALKLDPLRSSMTDIIEMAEKYTGIEMPGGSNLNPKLLSDCRTIYRLRNKYAHRLVTKEEALASKQKVYGASKYMNMTILKDDFQCKMASGEFY